MLYVPGELLMLVEAKFTSGNTIASPNEPRNAANHKPKSRAGLLKRYSTELLQSDQQPHGPFYSQLYRNLVFAIHMASKLGVRWGLVNLVCEGQHSQRKANDTFADPTAFVQSFLHHKSRDQFVYSTWERLYAEHVSCNADLGDLQEYMRNKSASGAKALAV